MAAPLEMTRFHHCGGVDLLYFRSSLTPEVRARAEQVLRLHEDEEGRAALEAAVATTRFEPLGADDLAELQAWVPILRPAGAVR